VISLSTKFKERVGSLYKSQVSRARQKQGPTGRISKKGYDLTFDQKQFTAWFLDQFGGNEGGVIRCKYCNVPLDAYSCVVDHEVPLKRGGSPALSNLGLPCEACNQVKGGMTPDEFRFLLDKLAEMSVRFASGHAVQDITSRLQKAVKLAAAMRYNIATRQKKAIAGVVGEVKGEEPF
jgi:5-methylcytosine-specific restriction endonuclease McrA